MRRRPIFLYIGFHLNLGAKFQSEVEILSFIQTLQKHFASSEFA